MTDKIKHEEEEDVEVFRTPKTSFKPRKEKSFRVKGFGHIKSMESSPHHKKELRRILKNRIVNQKKKIDAMTMKVARIDKEKMKFAKALIAAKYVAEKDRAEMIGYINIIEEERTNVELLSLLLEEERSKIAELESKHESEKSELSAEHKQEVVLFSVKIGEGLKTIRDLEIKSKEVEDQHNTEASSLKTKIKYQKDQIVALTNKVVSVEEENVRVGQELLEEKRKLTKLSDKHRLFLNNLRVKIQCPVCREVPRSGSVPACPNGHFVCSKCKTGICPTCRVTMGNCMSSLAVTVIENIDHKCKFDACQEYFALDKLEDHELVCSHRTVKCPIVQCTEEVALSNLRDHLVSKNDCCRDKFPTEVLKSTKYIMRGFEFAESKSELCWSSALYSVDGIFFVVFPVKLKGVFYFSFVMFSPEAVCSMYKIEMIVHEDKTHVEDSEVAYKYSGRPCSIDLDYNLAKHQGLTVDGKSMDQITKKGINGFRVSFCVKKK